MIESSRLHPALGRVLAGAMPQGAAPAMRHALGLEEIDRALGGGLVQARLHEVFAQDGPDEAGATAFAMMLALCLTRSAPAAPLLWLREERTQRKAALHGPGLVDLGCDPARLILGVLPDVRAVLRAGADALRCAALGAVILELDGNPPLLDLTASRRFALAAEESGVTPLLLRLRGARPSPSAAQTRWQVACAPSAPLEAGAPGHPALTLNLLRQRGGPAGLDWTVEWNRDAACFRQPALPGAQLPLSGGGPVPHVGTGRETGGDDGWRIAV
jgi:protein ImuA